MAAMYCALCQRPVEARRQIGAGTVVFAVLTAGLSLLAIPIYPKRCSICKSTAVTPSAPQLAPVPTHDPRVPKLEQQLEAAESEIDRLRTERDFYRQLLGDRAHETPPPGSR
jgi:hypothetical protein